MAIAVIVEFPGGTLAQYDKAIELMGMSPGGTHTEPGCIFHWVTANDDGVRVTDVWEDKSQFEAFARDKIGPLTEQAGFPAPPNVSFVEVHNYLTRP
ncbi:antibiotic biosynthesis monooxygenase [Arthrobacter sp. I2-34]|uniref:Antibiotic biosynthesis monooxygenase n=1 Tax=Arthrobacter hankyongi TaxID=2904801 RepID=A0ABS9L557_9MICC|nr:antibiotic biosynthesis monooxygenase [Arthrobacter hankyongi]MCG2621812.1 antibiotic biosynthesis monooxygenase [Arthrobacter hankyongi]